MLTQDTTHTTRAEAHPLHLRLLSDLHLEFMSRRAWQEFVRNLDNDCDVLVLAGDIATSFLDEVLAEFCDRFPFVVFVAGNHEFYGRTPNGVAALRRDLTSMLGNLRWLEASSTVIGGVLFHGATLWFPQDPVAPTWAMNDFVAIHEFVPWVYEQNARSVAYLAKTVRPGDIVVTHHLPSLRCEHPKFERSPMRPFFVCDCEEIIYNHKPSYWFHGHTHESVDVRIGNTRVLCNPRGYQAEHGLNPSWDAALTVGVLRP